MIPKFPYFLSFFPNFIFFFTIFASCTNISYIDHCSSVVPQYASNGSIIRDSNFLEISNGHFSGGRKLFSSNLNFSYFTFQTDYIRKTNSLKIFQVLGNISFHNPAIRFVNSSYRSTFQLKNIVRFGLSGFWSESSGKICMVGTSLANTYEGKTSLNLSAVFKLYNYPQIANISTSIVSGTVEILDSVNSLNYFEKINVSAYAQRKYSYTEFPTSIINSCSLNLNVTKENRSFERDYVGSLVTKNLRLEHESDCNSENCYLFSLKNGLIPSLLSLIQINFSEEGKFHTLIGFFNHTVGWFRKRFELENFLVGEGFWDHEKNQMCIIACEILENSSVGDCSIGISLWFPIVFTIKSRNHVMGRIWSRKNKNESGYFRPLSIRYFDHHMRLTHGMKYKFSLLDGTRECDYIKKIEDLKSKTYPDGSSKQDLSFSLFASKERHVSLIGHAYPLSIGETVFADFSYEKTLEGVNVNVWNVSYEISCMFYTNFPSPRRHNAMIFAEGKYNIKKGHLCLVGCMFNRSSYIDNQAKIEDSMDCNVLINVQFPHMNPKEGEKLEGTIKSTRRKSDPLYFEPLSFSKYKMYEEQASESIWLMNVEFIMFVIYLTLLCVFIRSQIIYAKKNKVLPSISITMLVVMTLGCLFPLIFNFGAMFSMIQNKENSMLWNDEWIMVKEVVITVLNLLSFVLHILLLQLTWSARCASEGKKGFFIAEKKSVKICLVLYFALAVIAWFVRLKRRSIWGKFEVFLCYYTGILLDGFLLPQIMFNVFQRSQEKVLSPKFYVGMTIIRIFPHFYDTYKANMALPEFQPFNFYASFEFDFYSLSLNIINPLVGIFFAILIFIQQCVGGDSIIPSRFRKQDGYVNMVEISL